jgi:hypothetical protein
LTESLGYPTGHDSTSGADFVADFVSERILRGGKAPYTSAVLRRLFGVLDRYARRPHKKSALFTLSSIIGDFAIHRISAIKKLRAKLKDLKEQLKKRMHMELASVGSWLSSVYRGWSNYHAIPGNYNRI